MRSRRRRLGACAWHPQRQRRGWRCGFCLLGWKRAGTHLKTEMAGADKNRDRALAAAGEELATLLHHAEPETLLALLDNPSLEEAQLCMLLERKNLPAEILEEVARRKPLLKNYRVKKALAF